MFESRNVRAPVPTHRSKCHEYHPSPLHVNDKSSMINLVERYTYIMHLGNIQERLADPARDGYPQALYQDTSGHGIMSPPVAPHKLHENKRGRS